MRVLQLIDSLRSGGAERMAVSYANALARNIDRSYLCCTRLEGLLKKQINPDVRYLFLNKKRTLDLKSFLLLRNFVRVNKISLIQAHGSSWFLASLVKMSLPGTHLVWHDHYGRDLQTRKPGALKVGSRVFSGIIAVNKDLEKWAKRNLLCSRVRFIRNFIPLTPPSKGINVLKGGKRFNIVCLANLRPQKDHFTLLEAFRILIKKDLDVGLHLIGKDEENEYSKKIRSLSRSQILREKVFLYGEQKETSSFLADADIGVLSSSSEGLPLALLEYGRSGLPVICTAVGECPEVIKEDGLLVAPEDSSALAGAIEFYMNNRDRAVTEAKRFNTRVMKDYSEKAVILEAIGFFEGSIKMKSRS